MGVPVKWGDEDLMKIDSEVSCAGVLVRSQAARRLLDRSQIAFVTHPAALLSTGTGEVS
jgi:hypothetical protein